MVVYHNGIEKKDQFIVSKHGGVGGLGDLVAGLSITFAQLLVRYRYQLDITINLGVIGTLIRTPSG